MLRYHTTQGGYSISFRARQCWCVYPRVSDSHFRCATSWPFEIGAMCHLLNDSLEGLCNSGHCDYQDWFMGQYKCRMPVRWCWLYLQQAAGHPHQSLERIPLPFFTDNARKVVVRQNHPIFKGIPPQNGQWQPHNNFLGHQFAKHCYSNRGESRSKTHFFRQQCSWHIIILNLSPHDEPDGPHVVHQKLSFWQAWNWIFVAWNTVIGWLANRMGIQQPDRLI